MHKLFKQVVKIWGGEHRLHSDRLLILTSENGKQCRLFVCDDGYMNVSSGCTSSNFLIAKTEISNMMDSKSILIKDRSNRTNIWYEEIYTMFG